MAQRVSVDPRASVPLPAGADPVAVAGGVNAVMSSWVALRHRIDFTPGSTVLVLGATGAAGSAAVEVAHHLGAARVIAAGRDQQSLAALHAAGIATVISLDDSEAVGRAAAEADVVIDYVWGQPAARVMAALVTARQDRGKRLDWVAIGATAGSDAPIPSAALRASGLSIVGSGQGSVGRDSFVKELPAIVDFIATGKGVPPLRTVPMANVGVEWANETRERTVLVP